MSRKDRLISRVMMAFFIAIFGPVLLLSWKDWHQIIQIGKRTSALVDSALNMIRYSPTPFVLFTPTSEYDVHPTASLAPTLTLTATKTPLAIYTPSSTYPQFGSATPNDRSKPSQTLIPSNTSTLVPTATPLPSRTPKPARTNTPTSFPTLRPSNTPIPIPPTPRPTNTSEPPAPTSYP